MNIRDYLSNIPTIIFFKRHFYPGKICSRVNFWGIFAGVVILAIIGGLFYHAIFTDSLGGTGKEPHGRAAILWPSITMLALLVFMVYIHNKMNMGIKEKRRQLFSYVFFLLGFTLGSFVFYDFPFNEYLGVRQLVVAQHMSYILQETLLVVLWTLSISVFSFFFSILARFKTFAGNKKRYVSLYLRQILLTALPTVIGVFIILLLTPKNNPALFDSIRGAYAGIALRFCLIWGLILDLNMSIKEKVYPSPPPSPNYDVYISYSSKDLDKVRILVNRLTQRNVSVWFAENQIAAGESITRGIEEGISSSRFTICCLSPNFIQSKWCRLEYEASVNKHVNDNREVLIPVEIHPTAPKDIPILLRDKKIVTGIEDDSQLDMLAERLRVRDS